jgi:D-alanyl-D-alanine carboxypeptidase/D-alanyl-D-alanine-endopeptidase (penicillin-binding protein 4)
VLLSLLSALVLLVVAAGVVLVARPGPVKGWLADAPTPTVAPAVVDSPEPTPPPVLEAAQQGADGPTPAGVQAVLGKLIAGSGLGSHVNVSVVDVASGDSLFSAGPEVGTTPASTTKLVTAAAVLTTQGQVRRIATRVVLGSQPGEVVLIGGGDPTLAPNAGSTYPGVARLDQLAAKVKKALNGVAPKRVIIDGSLFTGPVTGPGWTNPVASGDVSKITALMSNGGRVNPEHHKLGGDRRVADPDLTAGQVFAKALGLPASAVSRGSAPVDPAAGPTPSDAATAPVDASSAPAAGPGAELARVESPPMLRLVEWMLQQSDNVIAEALARQVALAKGQPASFKGAADAVDAVVADLGLPADESDLHDGSGLSTNNRLTPTLLTDLLKLAASGTQPVLTGMFGGLPVAGWSGTLSDRFAGPSQQAWGVIRAKTGTLDGIGALSGEVVTRDGRLLVFAILANAVPLDTNTTRAALDRIASALVSCGCR